MIGNAKLARPGLAVDVINDNRHLLPDNPHARESSPHLIHLPDEGIASFTYTWVNQAGDAGAAYAIFGPGVGEPLELRIPDRPVSANMDWSDWTVGDYTLKQDLKFTHSDTLWRSDAATIEFSFDAFHPPYAYGANKDGCPSYTAVNRIEQSGHVKGKFVIGDRTVPFDTVGHRDHSWGTRDWGAFQHYQWFQGQSEDGVPIHFWRFWALGQVNLRGYVFKDGLLAKITDVQTDIKFDEGLWQQRMTAAIVDEVGRTTKVTTEFYAHYTLKADPTLHLREAAGRATFDGSPALGWLEVAWPPAYLDYVAANGPY